MKNIQIHRAKLFAFLFFTILMGLSSSCAKKNGFIRMVPPDSETGLLYLFRPDHVSLALWNYDCVLSTYPGKFSSTVKPTPIYKIELENASLGYIKLKEGTYQLDVLGKPDATKVFQIKKGEAKYVEFKIFSETKFSRSEIIFRDSTKESALDEILSMTLFAERPFESVQMPVE